MNDWISVLVSFCFGAAIATAFVLQRTAAYLDESNRAVRECLELRKRIRRVRFEHGDN